MEKDETISERLLDVILNRNGHVYVCGDGNQMARDVQRAISKLIKNRLGDDGTPDSGMSYLNNMKTNGRFLMDIWTG